jgi:hypothetical protein
MKKPTKQQQKVWDTYSGAERITYWVGRGQQHLSNSALLYLIQQMLEAYRKMESNQ